MKIKYYAFIAFKLLPTMLQQIVTFEIKKLAKSFHQISEEKNITQL